MQCKNPVPRAVYRVQTQQICVQKILTNAFDSNRLGQEITVRKWVLLNDISHIVGNVMQWSKELQAAGHIPDSLWMLKYLSIQRNEQRQW